MNIKNIMNTINAIILDLDHTLVETHGRIDGKAIGDFEDDFNFAIFKRPHLDKFLEYCFKKFDHVVIWSLGTRQYVEEIIGKLLKQEYEPLLILARDNCYRHGGQWWKNTKKLKALFKEKGICFSDCQCIFIDDLIYRIKAEKNVKVIKIKPFKTLRIKRTRTNRNNKRKRIIDTDDELMRLIKRQKI